MTRYDKRYGIRIDDEKHRRLRESQARFNARNPWYRAWQSAKRRCNSPKDISYPFYGGKGIKCLLSKEDVQFLWERDATGLNRPSLDRLNSSKDYTRDNCRFIEHDFNRSRPERVIGGKPRRARQDAPAREIAASPDNCNGSGGIEAACPDISNGVMSAKSGAFSLTVSENHPQAQ